MMSNHAEGFKHITFNTIKPIKTFIGNFEWQVITGRLENSGFTPPRTDLNMLEQNFMFQKLIKWEKQMIGDIYKALYFLFTKMD